MSDTTVSGGKAYVFTTMSTNATNVIGTTSANNTITVGSGGATLIWWNAHYSSSNQIYNPVTTYTISESQKGDGASVSIDFPTYYNTSSSPTVVYSSTTDTTTVTSTATDGAKVSIVIKWIISIFQKVLQHRSKVWATQYPKYLSAKGLTRVMGALPKYGPPRLQHVFCQAA